jgi:hypothetical protein
MSVTGLFGIKKAVANLDPDQVRQLSERPVRITICAASTESYQRIENFLLRDLDSERRRESSLLLSREATPAQSACDLTIYDEGVLAPARAPVFRIDRPDELVRRILDKHADLGVPLARAFQPFRRPFVQRIVAKTCRENTLFSIATALPDVIPNIIELPWAIAEFASDTAFLTTNQLRMAFLIAAASDREVGYREQKSEVASVIASAFGWRALARQLVGKIPFGGGLIAKAAVAYAGTRVLGLSLDHLYSIGYTYTREERESLYADALRQGRKVAAQILQHVRPDLAAKFASNGGTRPAAIVPSRTEAG